MKHGILTLLIIVCLPAAQTLLNAQTKFDNKIGITASSLGVNDIFGDLGDANYSVEGKNFFTLGATYIRGFNKWLNIETGLEYSRHNISVARNDFPGTTVFMRTSETQLHLFNVPATLRANFLKYFFVNGGILIDIDISNDMYLENQTGIGGIVGVGVNYDFDFGLSLFLNPYIKAHSWIDVGTRQKILEKGFRLGITYDLRKIIKKK
jgi:hypothetical protein